jgi:hypothetical protein
MAADSDRETSEDDGGSSEFRQMARRVIEEDEAALDELDE